MIKLFLPDQLDEDLERVLGCDEQSLLRIADAMDSASVIGKFPSVVRKLAGASNLSPELAGLVYQVARFLAAQAREAGIDEAAVVAQLAEAYPELATKISARQNALEALVRRKPVAAMFRKRERLSTGVVKTLVEVEGYCDIRPVFDEERTQIVDSVSVVLVRLVVEDDQDDDDSFILQLNKDSIEKLSKFLDTTKQKLSIIESTYQRND
jgi:hypothetical protein